MSEKFFPEFDDEEVVKEDIVENKPTKTKKFSKTSKEQLLLKIFGGNDYHSKALVRDGNLYYLPEDGKLTAKLLNEHVNGLTVLGAYQIDSGNNTVNWIAWDIDCINRRIAREYANKILQHISNLPYAVEFSGSKGYHIFLFLEEPMSASKAKQIAESIRDAEKLPVAGDNHVECFPKQGRLTRDKPKGSLLKIPLSKHPKTEDWSRFVDPAGGWEDGLTVNPAEALRLRVKNADVEVVLAEGGENPIDLIAQSISPYWTEGSRHDLALYLCGFLANEGWSSESASDLIIKICEITDDKEVSNRMQTVKSTFERYVEGKKIRGRQGLAESLPSAVMHEITSNIAIMAAPDTLREIDDIRFTKNKPAIQSARLAADVMWDVLTDGESEIIRVGDQYTYWFNSADFSLQDCSGEKWEAMLNKEFGMNRSESFSRLTLTELQSRLVNRSINVPVYKTIHWDSVSKRLFVNLGGAEVYVISGKNKIEIDYNGACGFFFETKVGDPVKPDFSVEDHSAFNYLIHDLSFTSSIDCPATPEQQMELIKAWLISYFFPELMPTRPILSIIGAPGSGKTTAMRRFIKVLEDPEGDVLGVPTDKQDAFRSSIENHRLLVLDNLERSGVYWMVDILNKLSTGATIELRKLFKTNETYTIKPECYVALTAVKIPFSEETLFSRLLVLEMDQISDPIPEFMVQRTIKENLPKIWGSLLFMLGKAVEVLKKPIGSMKAPTSSRLADFSVLCKRLASTDILDGDVLHQGLLAMTNLQMHQLSQSSPAVVMLQDWVEGNPTQAGNWILFGELYQTLLNTANVRNMKFPWKDSTALLRHLMAVRTVLEKELQFEATTGNGRFDPSQPFSMRDLKVRFNTFVVEG